MLARGYIEGYYGRLPDWSERYRLLEHLQALSMTHYFYAPKEDVCHRLRWRQPYADEWRAEFGRFCEFARNCGVEVIAGIAPGLDFEFATLSKASSSSGAQNDFDCLCSKARQLLADGASELALLMDDIDPGFDERCGSFTDEGVAHATLANRLASTLDVNLFVVPRVYADEIAEESPDYLEGFCATLSSRQRVFFCGSLIVPEQISTNSLANSLGGRHEALIWDNLYANDYCPRRLFLGPYSGRNASTGILLNPTGLVHTDCLLLTVMQTTLESAAVDGEDDTACNRSWQAALHQHGVPEAFLQVSEYFSLPAFGGRAAEVSLPATASQFEALEHLLWNWKTPLSREWFPFLMGLKQDLLLAGGQLPLDRIHKTQLPPLANQLAKQIAH